MFRLMEILLAYAAGLLTLINPCVLPVVPIVLATALHASRFGPLALTAGMSLSFVAFGLLITSAGHSIGLTEDLLSRIGAVIMIGFGLVLLVPRLNAVFTSATTGLSSRADARLTRVDHTSLTGQFLGGLLLGAVWSPCIGPTLGGAIALASQGKSLFMAGLTMLGFAAGVSTMMLALAYGLRATSLPASLRWQSPSWAAPSSWSASRSTSAYTTSPRAGLLNTCPPGFSTFPFPSDRRTP